jgi:POT family proton-dependent oligopeptide transporter
MIFAVGEMMSSPTLSSFIALITPKGKEGLYQGTYFLPIAAGNFFTGFISGDLYQKWSDKLSLLKTEMASRNLAMPQVVSKEQFIEEGSKALNMSVTEFENHFHLKNQDLDYESIGQQFLDFARNKGIDVSNVSTPFSKSEYFELAQQKLGMSHWEMTNMLWENYSPNKIWIVIFGVGIFSIVALSIYDRLVVKPLENNK